MNSLLENTSEDQVITVFGNKKRIFAIDIPAVAIGKKAVELIGGFVETIDASIGSNPKYIFVVFNNISYNIITNTI
jgi:hypothetical protein